MTSTQWWALVPLDNQEVFSDLRSKSTFKSPAFSFLQCMQTSLPFEHSTSHNSCFAVNAHFREKWDCLLPSNALCYTSTAGRFSWAKLLPLCFQCPNTGKTVSHQDSILKVPLFLLVAEYPTRLSFTHYFILFLASPFCKRYISTIAKHK